MARVADDNADKPDYLKRGVIARGLGRSYNESGQNSGGLTIDMTPLTRIHSLDEETGIVDVDAGLSIDHLMKVVVPRGFWVPVMPGTRQVTIGGASRMTSTARVTTSPAASGTPSSRCIYSSPTGGSS